jgi:hypothetical protein
MNHSSDAMEPARRPIIQYETKANMQGGTTRNGNRSNSTCFVHNVVRVNAFGETLGQCSTAIRAGRRP